MGEPTREEAQRVLQQEIDTLRRFSYEELLGLRTKPFVKEVQDTSGITYSMEINVFWDSKRDGDLRVMVFVIPWGKWQFRIPRDLTDDFIMAPDGSFVGE
jgi:hypothetical protein